MNQKRVAAVSCGAALVWLAPVAAADTFNDLGAFLAAAPGATLVNFDTLPGGGPAATGEIGAQYAAVGLNFSPGNTIISGFAGPVSPPNGWLNNTFVGADPTFDVDMIVPGVRAVGVHNVLFAAPNGAILRAFDSAGGLLEQVTSDSDSSTLDFFGVTTTADIARVTISVTMAGGWGLDDLYVGESGGPSCYADCDESGSLDFFDFLCFQNAFAAGEKYADCDGSGSLDFFDFLCFQNEFAAGCGGGGGIDQFGTEVPPRLYCGEQMTQFPLDGRPLFTDVTTVPSPLGGNVTFSTACNIRQIGSGWATWSHGYTGSVYYTNGAATLDVSPPANSAFYLYVEPNPFADIEFEITRDGGDSVVETINGSSGAKGYGFCGGVKTVNVRTTDGFTDFAVGEFGIAN